MALKWVFAWYVMLPNMHCQLVNVHLAHKQKIKSVFVRRSSQWNYHWEWRGGGEGWGNSISGKREEGGSVQILRGPPLSVHVLVQNKLHVQKTFSFVVEKFTPNYACFFQVVERTVKCCLNRKLQIRYCVHVLLNVAYYYLFPLELCYHDLLADSNCVPLLKVEERRFTIWNNVHRLTATYMWNKHFPWPLSPVDELCLWSELCGLTSQKLIFIANLMEILNFTCTSYERLFAFCYDDSVVYR